MKKLESQGSQFFPDRCDLLRDVEWVRKKQTISGYSSVAENLRILGFYTVSTGKELSTFLRASVHRSEES
jgi:preprotein translocase subunit SecE